MVEGEEACSDPEVESMLRALEKGLRASEKHRQFVVDQQKEADRP
jgi:hypothetical protein